MGRKSTAGSGIGRRPQSSTNFHSSPLSSFPCSSSNIPEERTLAFLTCVSAGSVARQRGSKTTGTRGRRAQDLPGTVAVLFLFKPLSSQTIWQLSPRWFLALWWPSSATGRCRSGSPPRSGSPSRLLASRSRRSSPPPRSGSPSLLPASTSRWPSPPSMADQKKKFVKPERKTPQLSDLF